MIDLKENSSLKAFNTFGIDAKAKYLCTIETEDQLHELMRTDVFRSEKRLLLGGGSNILLTKDFDGLVIRNIVKGIEKVSETDEHIYLRVASGEVWHELVMHCVQKNWGGIENLSLIPGTVGAAPIQNIGAYGVEVGEVIENVNAIRLSDGVTKTFGKDECHFGYRESVFKSELKEKFFISSVTLRLTKKKHQLNIQYGAINDTLMKMNITQPTIQSVSEVVIKIRQEKLPDYTVLGNAGSFFKNTEITIEQFHQLQTMYPAMPHYPTANQQVKIPSAWLIEQCGWKGKKINHVGVHASQALVLVNFGEGKGEEILALATKIIASVQEKFSITLTPEVNIF